VFSHLSNILDVCQMAIILPYYYALQHLLLNHFCVVFVLTFRLLVSSIHPPPAFGSSTNLEALALEASKSQGQDHDSTSDNGRSMYRYSLLLNSRHLVFYL
jgi:hypothetical protein